MIVVLTLLRLLVVGFRADEGEIMILHLMTTMLKMNKMKLITTAPNIPTGATIPVIRFSSHGSVLTGRPSSRSSKSVSMSTAPSSEKPTLPWPPMSYDTSKM
jgi:hypothetical protein